MHALEPCSVSFRDNMDHKAITELRKIIHSISRQKKTRKKQQKLRVLSLDGGGIRGIIPAQILAYIEHRIQNLVDNPNAKLVDYVDLMAGTSTGGILTLLYLMGNDENSKSPILSAQEVLEIFLSQGAGVFAPPLSDQLNRSSKNAQNKYGVVELEARLKDLLGSQSGLSSLVKPTLVTAYDILNREPVLFDSWSACYGSDKDYLAWEVARATSAAPGFFEPAKVNGYGRSDALIDGSVFAANPAMCALTVASSLPFSKLKKSSFTKDCPDLEDMMVLSISTGASKNAIDPSSLTGSRLGWIRPVIEVLLAGNAEAVDYQLKQLFPAGKNSNKNYFRLEPQLIGNSNEIDNVDSQNLTNLEEAGKFYILNNKEQLEEIAWQLTTGAN